MNIRKNIDYSEMYEELDMLMAQQLPQMELYCGIGKAVCRRIEKGAAVMASEYLNKQYPDVKGFSPRSLRRMRDFYRTYENHPALLSRAMEIGWIQNVVIMEADLTMEMREWYIKAVIKFEWPKTELIEKIMNNEHEKMLYNNEKIIDQTNRQINMGSLLVMISEDVEFVNQIHKFLELKKKRRCWYNAEMMPLSKLCIDILANSCLSALATV